MKKLMMLLTVVMTVGLSQAAFVDWQISLGKEEGANKTYFVFLDSQKATVDGILGAFDDKSASQLESLSLARGSLNAKKGAAAGNSLDVGNEKALYMIVLDSELAAGQSYKSGSFDITSGLYTPPSSSPGQSSAGSSVFVNSGKIVAAGTDPVTPGGVPEPTSGLLLVLGGAALALRRKQK